MLNLLSLLPIDYAELFRYETGVIHPPVLAGTCHLSPVAEGEMQGGDFMVNGQGIEHYRKFGYKARLAPDLLEEDTIANPHWRTVKFQGDRGILHSGSWPHLSTRISRLPAGRKRVILGFNAFCGDAVAQCCARAPEHSDAFNRTVKLYQVSCHIIFIFISICFTGQTIPQLLPTSTTSNEECKIDISAFKNNKALLRILLRAAKEKREL